MARKPLDVDFYAKVLLITIIIPYAVYYMLFVMPTDIWGKILSLLFLGLVEYTFFKMTINEYNDALGKRKPYIPPKSKKPKK
jgi:hypothetical protein